MRWRFRRGRQFYVILQNMDPILIKDVQLHSEAQVHELCPSQRIQTIGGQSNMPRKLKIHCIVHGVSCIRLF